MALKELSNFVKFLFVFYVVIFVCEGLFLPSNLFQTFKVFVSRKFQVCTVETRYRPIALQFKQYKKTVLSQR